MRNGKKLCYSLETIEVGENIDFSQDLSSFRKPL